MSINPQHTAYLFCTQHISMTWLYQLLNTVSKDIYMHLRVFSFFNQSTVSTAKRLASLIWYLIASTIDILYIILSMAMKLHVNMELEVQHIRTCMYDPDKCWFYISKTYCFCFLLTLNCENLAKQLLPLAIF